MTVTAEQIKAYREQHGVGLVDAKRILEREDRRGRLDRMATRLSMFDFSNSDAVDLIQIIREIDV